MTKEQKREYDRIYREKNKELIKKKKQVYNKSPAGRAMQKRSREKRRDYHLEYCRTEKYKAWKKEYDKEHRAKKKYGEFWESAILLNQISDIVDNRQAVQEKRTINKAQKRKRKQIY
jgi:Ni,Fe-hydrogenase III large subunit